MNSADMAIDLDDEFFATLESQILSKNWDWVGQRLTLPLVAYASDQVVTLKSFSELSDWLNSDRGALDTSSTKKVVSEITEFRPVSATMASYLVTHSYMDENDICLGIDTFRYFACKTANASVIEMIEKL